MIDDGLGGAPTPTKVALIDADTIAYTTCLELEVQEELLPKEFYTDDEWEELINHPGYHEETHSIYTIDYDLLVNRAKSRIDDIISETFTKGAELYFSSGKNFRHELCDMYKGNRTKMRYPEGLEWLKQELTKEYAGEICDGYEADDKVVYLKRKYPKKYVLCAIDKDVLNAVPGKHFDYYHGRFHFIETDIHTATKWPYLQCLTGDTADNIEGIRGIGPKRAEKLFEGCELPCDYWNRVVDTYVDKGKSIKQAIETMRLVWMHSLQDDGTIKLWEPPCVTNYERSKNGNTTSTK